MLLFGWDVWMDFRVLWSAQRKYTHIPYDVSILSNKNGQKIEKFHGCANIVCRLAHLRRYGSSLQPTTVASEPADWTNRSTVCCGRELLYFRVNVIEKEKKRWKFFCFVNFYPKEMKGSCVVHWKIRKLNKGQLMKKLRTENSAGMNRWIRFIPGDTYLNTDNDRFIEWCKDIL